MSGSEHLAVRPRIADRRNNAWQPFGSNSAASSVALPMPMLLQAAGDLPGVPL